MAAKKVPSKPTGRDADFTPKTRVIIAARAGYRCSVPDCRRHTIGAGSAFDEVSDTGTACHIYSSAFSGPRGTGGKSSEERSSPRNGFWACATHARAIDANAGNQYPPTLLLGWKAMHEAWISREQGGLHSPFGWLHHIDVQPNRLFERRFQMTLAKITLVAGNNGTGKTGICDWIAGSIDPFYIRKWVDSTFNLNYNLTFYSPELHEIHVSSDGGQPRYSVDGMVSPIPLVPMRVVYVPYFDRKETRFEGLDDIDFIGEILGLRREQVLAFLLNVSRFTELNISGLHVKREASDGEDRDASAGKSRVELFGNTGSPVQGYPFSIWSTGEQYRAILAIASDLAEYYSRSGPTLLILDSVMDRFDDNWKSAVVRAFESDLCHFQVVMTSLGESNAFESISRVDLAGYSDDQFEAGSAVSRRKS